MYHTNHPQLAKTQNYHHSSTQIVIPSTTQVELGGEKKLNIKQIFIRYRIGSNIWFNFWNYKWFYIPYS